MTQINGDILRRLFNTTITVYPKGSVDSLGDFVEGTPMTFHGYVVEKTEKVVNALGDEVLAGVHVYLTGADIEQIDIHSSVSCGHAVKQPILAKELWRGEYDSKVIGVLHLP